MKSGLVTSSVSFDEMTNFMNPKSPEIELVDNFPFIPGIVSSTVYDCNGNQVTNSAPYRKVSDVETEVKCWSPAERISGQKFAVFPMHVSQNLLVYVLEANRKTVADKIEAILEQKYQKKQLVRRDAIEWKQGDACFARFGFGKFYRATIRRINFAKNSCVVSVFLLFNFE